MKTLVIVVLVLLLCHTCDNLSNVTRERDALREEVDK